MELAYISELEIYAGGSHAAARVTHSSQREITRSSRLAVRTELYQTPGTRETIN